ncbi:hypothetical protein [Amycolatopsis alba]|uniref:IrrE N-terminal-like domain-containing protein n=2 Tax=Amycolatopsis alba TaxID=76020 RepID=A0A229RFB9_AMYAL|nr:hypothetical protein [Amycolatopsis alba]OXM45179.1 hypothetical protein CFP75_31805 [Amycolatopsis alba DSM 44262]
MPTRLLPLPAALPGSGSMLTGMTVRLNNTAYIFYRADTSLIHQLHVIHHELFHAMEHHPGMLVSDPVIKDALAQLLRPDLPNLSSELIRHLVGRSCRVGEFQDKHERDAERFAVVMAYRLGLTVPMNGENDAKPEADRLHRLLSNGCP